jgi:flagellar motor switch protein FliM
VTFRFERLETNPRFATIGRPANAAVLARLRIDMEDRGGRLEVLLPYATLEPVREILLQGFLGEKFGRDSIWEAHLAGELWHTSVPIEAVLDTVELPLHEVLALKVGSRIILNANINSDVGLVCGDLPMFSGKMGRRGGNIAIRITEKTEKKDKGRTP